jgi:hypothetical protein
MQKAILGFSGLNGQGGTRALFHQDRLNAGYSIQEMILGDSLRMRLRRL